MTTERYFTVAEAEALIPEMEAVFREIDGMRDRLARRMDKIKILDAMWGPKVRDPGNPDRDEFLGHRKAVRSAMREIEDCIDRGIIAKGVRFPQGGLEHGLVDFPTRFEGRTVFLCWQRGEDEIRAWHEVEAGFAGRRPLTADQAARMGRGDGPA